MLMFSFLYIYKRINDILWRSGVASCCSLLLPEKFDGMRLERLPLLSELSLPQNVPALQAEGSGRWERRRRRRRSRGPRVGIPALLLLLSSFGNPCWHTNRCLFERLHNPPTQWERTPQGCRVTPCGFPFLSLSLWSVVRWAERAGQASSLGTALRLMSSWGLDSAQCCTWKHGENGPWISGCWIRSEDLICLSEDKGSSERSEATAAQSQHYSFKLWVYEGAIWVNMYWEITLLWSFYCKTKGSWNQLL